MNIDKKYQNEISLIVSYYASKLKDDNLVLVGLNDDRGFSFQKNILYFIKGCLQSDKYDMTVFDAYSMFFNKTRYIDYYLKNNISLFEVELMKKYGTINEMCHVLGNNFISRFISREVYDCLSNPSSSDKSIRLSDTIKEAFQPMIVYSSGINDIMYQCCINPFSAKRYYYKDKERYDYAVSQVNGSKGQESIYKVIDGHKSNFDKILGINNGSKICSLGAYLYSSGKDYDKIFQDFVLRYNEELEKICKQYGIIYVNTRSLENTRFRNIDYTYFESVHEILAGLVLESFSSNLDLFSLDVEKFGYIDDGSVGVLADMFNYREKISFDDSDFYQGKREELAREEDVFAEVILNKCKVLKR